MSQKTNPISLRLEKKNQNFASPWFTDFFFTENFKHELEVRRYLDSLLDETGLSNAFLSGKCWYRKFNVFMGIQDTRVSRKEKQAIFRIKSSLSRKNRVARVNKKVESSFIESSFLKGINLLDSSYQKKEKRATQSAESFDKSANYSVDKEGCKIDDITRNTQYDTLPTLSLDSLESTFRKTNTVERFSKKKTASTLGTFTVPTQKEKFPLLRKMMLSDLLKKKLSYNRVTYSELPLCNKNPFPFQGDYVQGDSVQRDCVPFPFKGTTSKGTLSKEKLCFPLSHPFSVKGYTRSTFISSTIVERNYLCKNIKNRPYLSYLEAVLLKGFSQALSTTVEESKKRGGPMSDESTVLQNTLSTASKTSHRISTPCSPNKTLLNIYPIRFIQSSQNVIPFLDLVVLLLEKRVSFKAIKEKLFKDLSKNKMIKGIRITCSGRFGGKSKKAQKAKMQSDQWGQTSLSTFSSKLLFANKSANTSYGKIGIKVWIAFL